MDGDVGGEEDHKDDDEHERSQIGRDKSKRQRR